MKVLNVRFSDVAHLTIDDMTAVTGANVSEIARAAMYIGLMEIKALAARDVARAQEFVAINNLKAK